jgi:hypothetical protein
MTIARRSSCNCSGTSNFYCCCEKLILKINLKKLLVVCLFFLGVLVDEPRLAQNIRRGILQLKSEINHLL